MKKVFYIIGALLAVACASPEEKEFPESFSVTVKNPLDASRKDVMVFIPSEKLASEFNSSGFIVLDQAKEIASQFNKNDADYKGIVLVLESLDALESKTLTVRFKKEGESNRNYTKRTQAELSHKIKGEWKEREYIGGEFKN